MTTAKFFPEDEVKRAYPLVVGGGAIFAAILKDVASFGGFILERAELPPYGEVTLVFAVDNKSTQDSKDGQIHGVVVAVVINDALSDGITPLERPDPATDAERGVQKLLVSMYKHEEREIERVLLMNSIENSMIDQAPSKNKKPL